jgi:hypothetical protein
MNENHRHAAVLHVTQRAWFLMLHGSRTATEKYGQTLDHKTAEMIAYMVPLRWIAATKIVPSISQRAREHLIPLA